MRHKEIDTRQIMNVAIELIAEKGIKNFTAKKAALQCGISEGSVFSNFKSKENLLYQCLQYIDLQLDEKLKEAQWLDNDRFQSLKNLWDVYYEFLIVNPKFAKFYNQYRHSSYYNRQIMTGQIKNFKYLVSLIQKFEVFKTYGYVVFWSFAIESTINFITRIFDGLIENTEKNKYDFFALLFNGISFLFNNNSN